MRRDHLDAVSPELLVQRIAVIGTIADQVLRLGLDHVEVKAQLHQTDLAIVDRHGLPLSVSTHAANHHEVRLVQLCFDFYMIEAKPENLIGDRAYDSDPLDEELRRDGIEMIA